MRKTKSDDGGVALVDAPVPTHAQATDGAPVRRPWIDPMRTYRETMDDVSGEPESESFLRRRARVRQGLMPQTKTGRIAAGVATLVCLGAMAASGALLLRFALTSERFRIPSSQAIAIDGNNHLSRAQMLSVFGEDVDRNIFRVPLEERRRQLEKMPWVEHATVMRLLPNRLRVQVTERTPVAFLREGSTIGMVDASGVLLDIPPDAPGNPNYTFPVVTGLKRDAAPKERAQRMRLFGAFLKDLDSDGHGTSAQLSEVDLSDAEDIRALIPEHNTDVLVHFGSENFLSRYKRFAEHIDEWRGEYPRLAGVDMRYERQVVLQMPPKDTAPVAPNGNATGTAGASTPSGAAGSVATAPVVTATAPSSPLKSSVAKTLAVKPLAKAGPASSTKAKTVAIGKTPSGATDPKRAKEIAMQKRVEAIKAWMAKREKLRVKQGDKVSLLDPVANPIQIEPVAKRPANGGSVTSHVVAPALIPVARHDEPKFVAAKYHATEVPPKL